MKDDYLVTVRQDREKRSALLRTMGMTKDSVIRNEPTFISLNFIFNSKWHRGNGGIPIRTAEHLAEHNRAHQIIPMKRIRC